MSTPPSSPSEPPSPSQPTPSSSTPPPLIFTPKIKTDLKHLQQICETFSNDLWQHGYLVQSARAIYYNVENGDGVVPEIDLTLPPENDPERQYQEEEWAVWALVHWFAAELAYYNFSARDIVVDVKKEGEEGPRVYREWLKLMRKTDDGIGEGISEKSGNVSQGEDE